VTRYFDFYGIYIYDKRVEIKEQGTSQPPCPGQTKHPMKKLEVTVEPEKITILLALYSYDDITISWLLYI